MNPRPAHYRNAEQALADIARNDARQEKASRNCYHDAKPRYAVELTGKQIGWLLFACLVICAVGFGFLAQGLRSAP